MPHQKPAPRETENHRPECGLWPFRAWWSEWIRTPPDLPSMRTRGRYQVCATTQGRPALANRPPIRLTVFAEPTRRTDQTHPDRWPPQRDFKIIDRQRVVPPPFSYD